MTNESGSDSDSDQVVRGYDYFSADPRLAPLLGPGGPFELEDIVLSGVPLKSFARAPRTIVDMFQAAKAHADLDHIVFEDERLTFADVRAQALAVASRLKSDYGVGRGDRVAIGMRNFPEFVVGFWSGAVLGAIVVPLNAWWTGPELQYALQDCAAKVVFADPERVERLQAVGSEVPIVGVRGAQGPGVADFAELASGPQLAEHEFAALEPDDPVTILYTSGTTGHPKGALGTNRATIANLLNMGFGSARELVLSGRPPGKPVQPASIGSGPLFHIGGIAGIVGGAMSGAKMVLMRKRGTAAALDLAVRERVTSLGGVPAVAQEILDFPGIESSTCSCGRFRWEGPRCRPACRVASVKCSARRSRCSMATGERRRPQPSSPTWERSTRPIPKVWDGPTSRRNFACSDRTERRFRAARSASWRSGHLKW